MVPVLNEVSATMIDKIQVVKIDTEKYPNIANKYRIEALPTFILFKDGEPCDRFVSKKMLLFFICILVLQLCYFDDMRTYIFSRYIRFWY